MNNELKLVVPFTKFIKLCVNKVQYSGFFKGIYSLQIFWAILRIRHRKIRHIQNPTYTRFGINEIRQRTL